MLCLCGRSFMQPNAFSKHTRTCQKSKKRLSSALEQAKQTWPGRKRRRLDADEPVIIHPPILPGLICASSPATQDVVGVRDHLLLLD